MSSHEPRLSEMVGIRRRRKQDKVTSATADAAAIEVRGDARATHPREVDHWDDDDLEQDRSVPMWAINLVMLLLGAAILYVAFKFLDPAEPELIRNPWTYALATPVLLLVLSIVLNSLASRVIEKSMQLALLISVLVHLLLMVYAGNFVIMSRMWSSVMDSLAEQRQQLKRESLQAPQYVQLMTPPQPTKQRPDYLRFVPTEHQPTELLPSESPAIQLAKAERSELVTPSPRPSETVSPHLLERKEAATSAAATSEAARRLSRSELSRPGARSSSPAPLSPVLSPTEAAQPEPALAASRLETRRRESPAAAQQPNSLRLPENLPSPSSASAANRRMSSATVERATPAASEPAASEPPPSRPATALSRRAAAAAPALAAPTAPPIAAEASNSEPSPMELATAGPARRRESRLAAPLMRVLPSDLPPRETVPITPATTLPSLTELTSPTDLAAANPVRARSSGEASTAIARAVAGGAVGNAAPSSMPVRGVEALRSDRQGEAMQLQAAASTTTRRTGAGRSSVSPRSEVGLPQAPSWSGTPSLSAGVTGVSPAQLALAGDGQAEAVETADLSGARGAIERSVLGASPPVTAAASASEVNGASRFPSPANSGNMAQLEAAAGAAEQRTGLESAAATMRRRGRGTRGSNDSLSNAPALSAALATEANATGADAGISPSDGFTPQRAELAELGALPSNTSSASNASGTRGRDGLLWSVAGQSRLPANSDVQPLDAELSQSTADAMAGTPDVTMPGMRRSRGGESTSLAESSLAMNVDADLGLGGINRIAELVGPVLPSRRERDTDKMLRDQFDAQRFERREVGGPLAAGRDLMIPAPAFQQRLDRLRDRELRNELQIEPKTEQAIERGLAFLARYQRPDGSWRLQDFDTEVLMRSDTAATGLALLAFQGAGYTHKEDKYADQVGRALKFLAEHQTSTGDLYIPQDPASNQNAWLYSHAIAALAVCEAYGMTQDPELKPMAQRAIDFMVNSQDKSAGGWRYRPGNGTDTSVTGWFMMAFKSGQLAGLNVPADTFRRINGYLDASQVSARESHLYRYNPFATDTPQQRHGLQPTAVMTSVGLLMRLYFGWQRDRPEMIAGADYLLENIPRNGTRSTSLRDTYYWYYATQVIFHMGGDHWERWHDQLYPLLIDSQVTRGENEGSWDPYRPTPDLWARYGGRLYVTTLNLLSLEVSYRHLPLYEATAK